MRRREFITLIGGAAASSLSWPLIVLAQQNEKVYRIGFLANDPTIPQQPAGQAFLDGLREGGFVEGKNIIIERRFTEGRPDRYPDFAEELVRLGVDVMVVSSDPAILATTQASKTIPIVMVNAVDPVAEGIVPNLAHPGGNVTGLTQDDSAKMAAKRMQLIKDSIPHATKVAVLINPDLPYEQAQWKQLTLAVQPLNVTLRLMPVRQPREIESAFTEIRSDRPDALFVGTGEGFEFALRRVIVELATKDKLPVMSNFKETTEVGGLMSYGASRIDLWRRAAIYTSKILKGSKPGDLPIEQPVTYELVINLKTAKALNLEIPRNLLLVADEVIE
jgi:putative tryptophan/tyrosine transport system substrate-binding protein